MLSRASCSLNGFLASTEGSDIAPEGTGYLGLEPYDVYWSRVRDMYGPFENGMKSGTARVFDHQIPGADRESLLLDYCPTVLLYRESSMSGSRHAWCKSHKTCGWCIAFEADTSNFNVRNICIYT